MHAKKSSRLDFQAAVLAFLPALALLLNFLNFQSYPYVRAETLLVMGALLALPLLALVLSMLWRPAGYLVASIAIFAYIDSVVPIMEKLAALDSMGLRQRWRFAIYVGVILLVCWLLFRAGAVARKVLVVVFSVIVLSTVVSGIVLAKPVPSVRDNPQANFKADSSLPPYIHLIFDAHIGVNGVPTGIPGGATERDLIVRVLDRYGFRIFPAAFSHYNHTRDSLSNLLGFTESDRRFGGVVKRNRLFEALKARGYRIHVFGTDYLDYCAPDGVHVDYCYRFNATGLAGLKSADVSLTKKALLIAGHWLATMRTVQFGRYMIVTALSRFTGLKLEDVPLIGPNAYYDRSNGVNSMLAFRDFQRDVREHPAGTAFFIHVIIPHKPYIYDANCRPIADSRGWSSEFGLPMDSLPDEARIDRYKFYLPQAKCVAYLLDGWLGQLQQAGILNQATVVIHGDHGSRITSSPTTAHSNDAGWRQMVRDSFSALFAVHSPGLASGLDPVVKPINRLARELIEAPGRMSQPEPDGLFLMLEPSEGNTETAPLHRYPVPADFFAADKATVATDGARKP